MNDSTGFRRILAVCEPGPGSREVIRRAEELARHNQAHLGIAFVVDYGFGMDDDQLPILSPQEVLRELVSHFRRELVEHSDFTLETDTDVIIFSDPPGQSITDGIAEWKADLAVIRPELLRQAASGSWFSEVPEQPLGCATLVVKEERSIPRRRHLLASGWW
ncbi:MAG: universal stress protein [Magnetococcales bacterium]|nr:universal stress protein [Magnetococcales bacterium]MBF0157545.1 universal stress protein [Magnetococcales bacterium]